MNIFEAIFLGVIQGLTEFLPVSSSGHLVMAQTVLGIPMPGIFLEVMLHLATLLSVMIVYRTRLMRLVVGGVRGDRSAWNYILLLVVATIPAGLAGITLKDAFEAAFDAPMITGVMLLVTAALLYSTRFATGRRREAPTEAEEAAELEHRPAGAGAPSWPQAIGMGVAQAFAILPGISRSGSTITVGLWSKLDGERAAEFSFLMSIPAIAGAVVLQLGDMGDSARAVGMLELSAGFLAALISGVLAIKSLVWLVRRQAFHQFAYYVAAVGIAFIIYLSMG